MESVVLSLFCTHHTHTHRTHTPKNKSDGLDKREGVAAANGKKTVKRAHDVVSARSTSFADQVFRWVANT